MRSIVWLRADPRGKLLVAFLLLLVAIPVLLAAGFDLAATQRALVLFFIWPVLVPINAWVLWRRHRSLLWLVFHFLGALSLIPILVALLASPGKPRTSTPKSPA